jgi:NitT/TauT family transport system substrate-binding protein
MLSFQNRRTFLAEAAVAGAANVLGLAPLAAAAVGEPPPETTTVRLARWFGDICTAPAVVVEDLLREEGFTDVQYLQADFDTFPTDLFEREEIDFGAEFAPIFAAAIAEGTPLRVLAGMHSGCLELIATQDIASLVDLRGKRVGVPFLNSSSHWWLTLMVSYIGLDPQKDIEWVELRNETASPEQLLKEGNIAALLGSPPDPQRLRAAGVGHTILRTAVDRPWSNYFCCMLAGHPDYVGRYPVATKRVVRAVMKLVDLCASNPAGVAQRIVDAGLIEQYDYALDGLTEARFARWRDFDPADSMRFFAVRMYEAGIIRASPSTIIDVGTDWRFLNEIKRELKT